jgi:hypothetical protein
MSDITPDDIEKVWEYLKTSAIRRLPLGDIAGRSLHYIVHGKGERWVELRIAAQPEHDRDGRGSALGR